nr:immunoglobulin light chain junction region [Macaca mulatta]
CAAWDHILSGYIV